MTVSRGSGAGASVDEGVEQLLHAEGVDGAAEEYRGLGAGQVRFLVKRVGGPFQQLDIMAQLFYLTAEQFVEARDRQAP